MNPEEITSFFVSQGLHVVRTASCSWYNEYHQDRIYHSFPPHRLITPPAHEIEEVFSQANNALALRFIGPQESGGQSSFIWVGRRPYDLEKLSANTRSRVRRGLRRCHVRSLSFKELVAKGWEAHRDTARRHGEPEPKSLGLNEKLDNCTAYEAWGAFVDDQLAAYAVTVWVEDWVHILLNRSVTAHLKSYPNNALIFSVVAELLSREEVAAISYGFEPLIAADSLESFKSAMGFSKQPVSQRIVLAPRLKLVVNPITARPLEALAGLLPNNTRLQKVAGFCRMSRQG